MSLLTTLLRLEAAHTQQAQEASTIRHIHLAERPMMILPLNRSGTAATPLAIMYGDNSYNPTLLVAAGHRATTLLEHLAADLTTYIETFQRSTEQIPARGNKPAHQRYVHAPQLITANPASAHYLKRLGRACRFTDVPEGTEPARSIARLGQWLTFFGERAEYPGSALLPALTDLLTTHWITGQSTLEDEHLPSLLAWIRPPKGMTGFDAALAAETPLRRPAGPVTDPSFDTWELDPLLDDISAATRAGKGAVAEHLTGRLHTLLDDYLRPTWKDAWDSLALLRGLRQTDDATRRWATDRHSFTRISSHLAADGRPQPISDDVVTAARNLATMEKAAGDYEARRALEDPFVMAELRTTGEALAGIVTDTQPQHTGIGPKGRAILRPRFTVRTTDPVRLDIGHLLAGPHAPKVHLEVCAVTPHDHGTDLLLEVTTQTGTIARPKTSSVPTVGDELTLTFAPEYFRQPSFPSRDNIPWTHGGPQHDYPAGLDDAEENQP
jgi:hypothetical protein